MKKLTLFAFCIIIMQLACAQGWNQRLISSTDNEIKVEVEVNGFFTNNVVTPKGDAVVITNHKMMKLAKAGEPDVPSIVIPAVIGDDALMSLELEGVEYVDYENMEVAPSKGNFPRSIDPDDVPYTYGEMYQQDAFFPSVTAKLDKPYIHRDVRAQNMMVTPYLYNAVTKTLRVYTHFTLKMVKIGKDDRNIIASRAKTMSLDPEFKKIYESRYINYAESMAKYNPIADDGELLIICYDQFMEAMEPFVAWKKQIGRRTTMVGTSETGSTAQAIKPYIEAYYAEHPNLTDILLVGDVAQIPGVYIYALAGYDDYSGFGDLQYGQLAGDDYYNEVIVGRFCCENEAQVINHVNKVLNYERDLDETATWLTVGQGVSNVSQAGHYGEADYEHIDNIRTDLLNYNYTQVYRDYRNVEGTTANSAADVSQHINQGVSIINYCNHGSETSWGVFSYNINHVHALTNDYMLPYVISVACLNGKYDRNGDCFAEAWMRATDNDNGNPTGAIGGMFSYISQPWEPPMYGQDEMIDILVESYGNNIRRTMGGVSINGDMKLLDLGAGIEENYGTYNNWVLFGDPTLTLRNAVPGIMNVTCSTSMSGNATSFVVNATNAEGALATLTLDGEILGSTTINGGRADITFEAPGRAGFATLTVFGYNKKTFITTIIVNEPGADDCPAPDNYVGENYYDEGEFGAHLAWDRAVYESTLDKFEIYRKQEGQEFEMVKRIVNTPSISHYECMDQVETAGLYIYRIIAFYQDGCESDPLDVEVEVIDYSSVNEKWAENVAVYPNPTSGVVNIKAEAMQLITVVNMMGQVVMTLDVDSDEVMIDMSAFDNGMYLVNIMTENGNIVKILNVLR